MQINIKFDKVGVEVSTIPEKNGEAVTLADIMTGMITGFTGIVGDYMAKNPPENEEDVADVYDALVYIFNACLSKLFPDIKPLAFELSDAGVLYAMDQIINEAHEKGITFDEAIAEYEKKAGEYVNARKMS